MQSCLRAIISSWLMIMITYYIFTTDAENEETPLDQVKDFTALIIIVDIDNILLNEFVDVQIGDIKLDESFEKENTKQVLNRYAKHKAIRNQGFTKIAVKIVDFIYWIVTKVTNIIMVLLYLFLLFEFGWI